MAVHPMGRLALTTSMSFARKASCLSQPQVGAAASSAGCGSVLCGREGNATWLLLHSACRCFTLAPDLCCHTTPFPAHPPLLLCSPSGNEGQDANYNKYYPAVYSTTLDNVISGEPRGKWNALLTGLNA